MDEIRMPQRRLFHVFSRHTVASPHGDGVAERKEKECLWEKMIHQAHLEIRASMPPVPHLDRIAMEEMPKGKQTRLIAEHDEALENLQKTQAKETRRRNKII